MTTSASRGSVREMSLRLCSRAPETTIALLGGIDVECSQTNRRSDESVAARCGVLRSRSWRCGARTASPRERGSQGAPGRADIAKRPGFVSQDDPYPGRYGYGADFCGQWPYKSASFGVAHQTRTTALGRAASA